MKRVLLLGSTGSIGENTLRVVESLPAALRVTGLAVNRDYAGALRQAARLGVTHLAVADEEAARSCAAEAPPGVRVYAGSEGVTELAATAPADIMVCAVVGMAGLQPVLAALGRGLDVALATKEVLVSAGDLVTRAAHEANAALLPVDSEHSAIFQCLNGRLAQRTDSKPKAAPPYTCSDEARRLVLTASGGPFAARPEVDFDNVSVEEALNHPRWDMGRKISVDSATLMNKGLEIIEARWLFDMPLDRIDVVLHPESIVHSLVEFIDGSILAQLSVPDMRLAIQYALTFPERTGGDLPLLDLAQLGALHFSTPDTERFPCLTLAREAAYCGGTMPAVLNAANEVAVHRFLQGDLPFSGIWRLVETVMRGHEAVRDPDLDAVVQADAWARRTASGTET